MANVTIAGVVYPLQLDTGSSDLWVKTTGGVLPGVTSISLTYNITYGSGYASGPIVTAPVSFAGYTVPSQALLAATSSNNPIIASGAVGILGLGFSSLSEIESTVSSTTGGSSTSGNTFLYNAFAQDTTQPNYLAFALERKHGATSDQETSFSIGEVDPMYQGILQTEEIATWPASSPQRWTLLLDGYEYADGVKRSLGSSVAGATSAVMLADTGSSYAYAPPAVVNGLYGGIAGASFDSATNTWSVPCDAEVNFALWIGGRKFDWHPLDVVVSSPDDATSCYGSIIAASGLEGYDFLAGDVFLRSVYTVLDFGDYNSDGTMGDPYFRFWSLIDQPTASTEFHTIRGGTPQPYTSSSTADPNAASAQADIPVNASNSTTVSADQVLVQNVNTLVSYAPIALGVLGLNAVLLLVLCGFAVAFMCRRKKGKKGRTMANLNTGMNLSAPALSRSHSYQQVKGGDMEDAETPLKQLSFSERGRSASLQVDTEFGNPLGGSDGDTTAVNESFRMSTIMLKDEPSSPAKSLHHRDLSKGSQGTPSSATFLQSRLSPAPSPTKGDHGLQEPMASSPSTTVQRLPSPAPSHSGSLHSNAPIPQVSVAPPGPSRSEEYLAALEARRAAMGQPNRRNTFQPMPNSEPLLPPVRSFQGGQGERRVMSAYMGDGVEREPLQRPRLQLQDATSAPEQLHGVVTEEEAYHDASNTPVVPSDQQSGSTAPSRSQEYMVALEARRAALSAAQEDPSRRYTYHDPSEEPMATPTRRFRGPAIQDGGRRQTYVEGQNFGDRDTVYFDAAGSPHSEGPAKPSFGNAPRSGGPSSPVSPLQSRTALHDAILGEGGGTGYHARTASSNSNGAQSQPSSSPSRSTFNNQPPRSNSNLGSSLGPSRLGAVDGSNDGPGGRMNQARPGSYAGYSSTVQVPRGPSNLGPQGLRAPVQGRPRMMSPGEEDLADQSMRPSFEERTTGAEVDAFADSPIGARQRMPRAPFAAPEYRYSSA